MFLQIQAKFQCHWERTCQETSRLPRCQEIPNWFWTKCKISFQQNTKWVLMKRKCSQIWICRQPRVRPKEVRTYLFRSNGIEFHAMWSVRPKTNGRSLLVIGNIWLGSCFSVNWRKDVFSLQLFLPKIFIIFFQGGCVFVFWFFPGRMCASQRWRLSLLTGRATAMERLGSSHYHIWDLVSIMNIINNNNNNIINNIIIIRWGQSWTTRSSSRLSTRKSARKRQTFLYFWISRKVCT